MNRESLITAIAAGLITSNDKEIPLMDEDFRRDDNGEWVRMDGAWRMAKYAKYMDMALRIPFCKTWYGDTPQWVLDEREKHREYCARIDALERYAMLTTHEHRILRHAEEMADRILNEQSK